MNGILSSKMIGRGVKLTLDSKTGKYALEANPDLTSIGYNDRGELVVLSEDDGHEEATLLMPVSITNDGSFSDVKLNDGRTGTYIGVGYLYDPATGKCTRNSYFKEGVTSNDVTEVANIALGKRVDILGRKVNLMATNDTDGSITEQKFVEGDWTPVSKDSSVQTMPFKSWRVTAEDYDHSEETIFSVDKHKLSASINDRPVVIYDKINKVYDFVQVNQVYSDVVRMTDGQVNFTFMVNTANELEVRVTSFEHGGETVTSYDALESWKPHLRAMMHGMSVAPETFFGERYQFVSKTGDLSAIAGIWFDFYDS